MIARNESPFVRFVRARIVALSLVVLFSRGQCLVPRKW